MMTAQKERKPISLEEKLNVLRDVDRCEDLNFLDESTYYQIITITSEYDSQKPSCH
jgi:hypothetical protein